MFVLSWKVPELVKLTFPTPLFQKIAFFLYVASVASVGSGLNSKGLCLTLNDSWPQGPPDIFLYKCGDMWTYALRLNFTHIFLSEHSVEMHLDCPEVCCGKCRLVGDTIPIRLVMIFFHCIDV